MKDEGSKRTALLGFILLLSSLILSVSQLVSSEVFPKPAGAEIRMSRAWSPALSSWVKCGRGTRSGAGAGR